MNTELNYNSILSVYIDYINNTNNTITNMINILNQQNQTFHELINRTNSMTPNTMRPNTIRPNIMRPNTMRPNTMRPNTMLPNTMRPNTMLPNTMLPNTMLPNTMRPNTMRPNTMRPNIVRTNNRNYSPYIRNYVNNNNNRENELDNERENHVNNESENHVNNESENHVDIARENHVDIATENELINYYQELFTPLINRDSSYNNIVNFILNGEYINSPPTNEDIENSIERKIFNEIENPLNSSCPISHVDFNDDSNVIFLKECRHIFSNDIFRWFQNNSCCPLCRNDIRRNVINDISGNVNNDIASIQSLGENIANIIRSELENNTNNIENFNIEFEIPRRTNN